jgi:hypothetical protein
VVFSSTALMTGIDLFITCAVLIAFNSFPMTLKRKVVPQNQVGQVLILIGLGFLAAFHAVDRSGSVCLNNRAGFYKWIPALLCCNRD